MSTSLTRAGALRLARAPLGYAALTVREYAALWTPFRLRDPGTTPALEAFVARRKAEGGVKTDF